MIDKDVLTEAMKELSPMIRGLCAYLSARYCCSELESLDMITECTGEAKNALKERSFEALSGIEKARSLFEDAEEMLVRALTDEEALWSVIDAMGTSGGLDLTNMLILAFRKAEMTQVRTRADWEALGGEILPQARPVTLLSRNSTAVEAYDIDDVRNIPPGTDCRAGGHTEMMQDISSVLMKVAVSKRMEKTGMVHYNPASHAIILRKGLGSFDLYSQFMKASAHYILAEREKRSGKISKISEYSLLENDGCASAAAHAAAQRRGVSLPELRPDSLRIGRTAASPEALKKTLQTACDVADTLFGWITEAQGDETAS